MRFYHHPPLTTLSFRYRGCWQDCIDAGKTVDGLAVREDPKREVRVMRYLNDATYIDCPGYHSVSKLLHVLADDTYLYLVLEYHAGEGLLVYPVMLHESYETCVPRMRQVVTRSRC